MSADYSELYARARAATPGPWTVVSIPNGSGLLNKDGEPIFIETARRADAEYIAALPPKVVVDLLNRGKRADGIVRARRQRAEAQEALAVALATIERVRDVVDELKHWNENCGWDVPSIELLRALGPKPDESEIQK